MTGWWVMLGAVAIATALGVLHRLQQGRITHRAHPAAAGPGEAGPADPVERPAAAGEAAAGEVTAGEVTAVEVTAGETTAREAGDAVAEPGRGPTHELPEPIRAAVFGASGDHPAAADPAGHIPAETAGGAAGDTVSSGKATDGAGAARAEWSVVLLQLSTTFCAPCRQAKVILADLAARTDGLRHVEFDLTPTPEVASALHVLRTPTTIALDAAGRELFRVYGIPKRDRLAAELHPHLPPTP